MPVLKTSPEGGKASPASKSSKPISPIDKKINRVAKKAARKSTCSDMEVDIPSHKKGPSPMDWRLTTLVKQQERLIKQQERVTPQDMDTD